VWSAEAGFSPSRSGLWPCPKSEEIKFLFSQFEAAASELEGIECWSARELQVLLGYSKWENFEKVLSATAWYCRPPSTALLTGDLLPFRLTTVCWYIRNFQLLSDQLADQLLNF